MTLPGALRRNGVDSLVALNRRLLAQTEEGTVAEEAAEDAIFGPDTPGYEQPDTEPEDTPEVRGRFAVEDPLEFNRVKEYIEQRIFGGSTTGMAPLINAFVNEWDVEFRRSQGLGPEDQVGTGATLEALLENEDFLNGATWLPLTAQGQLPPLFTSSLPEVDEEGNETGNTVPHIAVSSPLTGVTFHTIEEVAAQTPETRDTFRRLLRTDSDVSRALFASAIKQQRTDVLPIAGRTEVELTDVGSRGGEGIRPTGRAPQPPAPAPPEISSDELTAMWEAAVGGGGGGGRGGGGGGGTRRTIAFDKAHLIAQTEDLWDRRMLSADPAPTGVITSWVNDYIREATAFWAGEGGQLDFQTFVESKMEQHPRFQQIYKHKTPGETPEAFLQKFLAPIGGFGQSSEFTRFHTEQAVTSGAGPGAQAQRVSRTREVQGSGGFSQRLAETFRGLGIG